MLRPKKRKGERQDVNVDKRKTSPEMKKVSNPCGQGFIQNLVLDALLNNVDILSERLNCYSTIHHEMWGRENRGEGNLA